jgi:hypothetical protein
MLTIKDRSRVPKELYDYTVPETQVTYVAHGIGVLLAKVRNCYIANQIPVPENLAQIVEQDWCNRRPWHCGDPDVIVVKTESKDETTSLNNLVAAVAGTGADALAAISTALGIHCSKCQKRHKIIKEMKKRGFMATLRMLKETLHA